jgi:hypothetical protein
LLPKAISMPLLIAALLLSAAPSPPPDDDDDAPKRHRPPATAQAPSGDKATQITRAPTVAPRKDDDEPKPVSTGTPPSQPKADDDDEEARAQPNSAIVVTARKLDAARTQIDAALGSSVYSLTNDTIEDRPGGETGTIAEILSQAPGVTQSAQGLTIRSSAATQVRINNVIIPEAVSDPADQLSARLAETTRLITGTLPAQYGFAPAGVISVATKNGLYQHGGQAELFAGTGGMIEPAVEWAGSIGTTSLFASADVEHDHAKLADEQGISARDSRTKVGGLGFADHVIDADDRISLVFGGSREHHSIGPTAIGPGTELNSNGYAVGTFQHSDNGFALQASLFAGGASDESRFSVSTHEHRSSFGTQIDGSDAIGNAHTLRFGLLATRSTARELAFGSERSLESRTSVAGYAQDEWKFGRSLTFNPGARLEWLRGLGSGATLEPRASFVWQSDAGLTGHVGYARYASAPPLGEQPAGTSLRDEKDDYLDAGIQQKLDGLTVGADAYWRSAHGYLGERSIHGSAAPTAFAFRRARIAGLELSATYAHRATTAWANLSIASAKAKGILGGESLFAPAAIAAASSRYVPLGGDRPVTFSSGIGQRFGRVSLTGDLLISSGSIRTLDIADPNGSRHSAYASLGLAAVYHTKIAGQPTDLRLDLTNLTNVRYATNDASALEGGWTQFAPRRAISIGIEQGF